MLWVVRAKEACRRQEELIDRIAHKLSAKLEEMLSANPGQIVCEADHSVGAIGEPPLMNWLRVESGLVRYL